MIIKCPQCATGYNIPEKVLATGPRKMRCTKCKNTFTVTKRSEHPPSGYMEYTGAQQLPSEFAFLRADDKKKPPAAPPPSPNRKVAGFESDEDTSVGPAPQPPASLPPASPPPAAGPAPEEEIAVDVDVDVDHHVDQPVNVQSETLEPDRATQGGGTPIGQSMPAETMFGANSSAWEVEAPLELGGYALPAEDHHGEPHHQAAGKIVFALVVLVVGFMIFVAYRNNWSISLSALPEQVAFAFSGEASEVLPATAKNIDATIVAKKMVLSDSGDAFLMVSGEVINNNPAYRSNVILRGRLYDGGGQVRSEARMPCGKAVDEKAIKKTAKGSVAGHFSPDGKMYNCKLSPNGSTIFQIIFDEIPPDYDATFDVKVTAVAAIAG